MDYKILIADDEPEIRNLLRLYLENENYHVIEAEDGSGRSIYCGQSSRHYVFWIL